MLYVTRSDIEQIYGWDYLATLLPSDADPDQAMAGAIASECALIDGYLSVRYALPLARVPASIKSTAADLICYRLAASHDRLTDEITARAKLAREYLKDISAGRAKLGEAEPQVDGGSPAGAYSAPEGAEFSARRRQFRRGTLE